MGNREFSAAENRETMVSMEKARPSRLPMPSRDPKSRIEEVSEDGLG